MNEKFKYTSINPLLPYLCLGLIVFGIKLLLIEVYGNATPFWDQWDAEADRLYRPWIEGSFVWSDLFAPHNEHRIFTTRVLSLLLIEINGRVWNPLLQMRVNAFLHVLSICVLLFNTSKPLLDKHKTALFIFCTILFCIPFSWENTLLGIQSQPYFFLLFSFIFLWAMSSYVTYTTEWWLGFLCGILCVLTQAAGVVTLIAGALIIALRKVLAKEGKDISVSPIALLAIITIIAIFITPNIPGHASLKAQSIGQFLIAMARVFSWPDQNIGIGVFVIQIPLIIFMIQVIHKSDYRTPAHFYIFAMGLWLFGQFVMLAYGRSAGVTSSRYQDVFAVGLVTNFAALLILNAGSNNSYRISRKVVMVIWLLAIITGFAMSAERLSGELCVKAKQGLEQEKNVRAYLCTGDGANLRDKPFLYVPYPNPERLQNLLNNLTIRSILPGNIYERNSNHRKGSDE